MYKVIHPFNFYKQGDLVEDETAKKHGLQYFEKIEEPAKVEAPAEKEAKGKNKAITSKDIKTK